MHVHQYIWKLNIIWQSYYVRKEQLFVDGRVVVCFISLWDTNENLRKLVKLSNVWDAKNSSAVWTIEDSSVFSKQKLK